MWGKIVPESIEKELLEKLGSKPIYEKYDSKGASLVFQTVKNPPTMQETQVQSLGWEDPLEKRIATPTPCSCLENSGDRGAWRATVQGVAKSWTNWVTNTFSFFTRLKGLQKNEVKCWWGDFACVNMCLAQGMQVSHGDAGSRTESSVLLYRFLNLAHWVAGISQGSLGPWHIVIASSVQRWCSTMAVPHRCLPETGNFQKEIPSSWRKEVIKAHNGASMQKWRAKHMQKWRAGDGVRWHVARTSAGLAIGWGQGRLGCGCTRLLVAGTECLPFSLLSSAKSHHLTYTFLRVNRKTNLYSKALLRHEDLGN